MIIIIEPSPHSPCYPLTPPSNFTYPLPLSNHCPPLPSPFTTILSLTLTPPSSYPIPTQKSNSLTTPLTSIPNIPLQNIKQFIYFSSNNFSKLQNSFICLVIYFMINMVMESCKFIKSCLIVSCEVSCKQFSCKQFSKNVCQ